jgi:hypothetical protein
LRLIDLDRRSLGEIEVAFLAEAVAVKRMIRHVSQHVCVGPQRGHVLIEPNLGQELRERVTRLEQPALRWLSVR